MCILGGGIVRMAAEQMDKKKYGYKLNLISQDIKLACISFFSQAVKCALKP